MTESFLHYLFDTRKLGKSFQTTEGENLDIVEFGKLNKSSGPDFLEASLKFDNKIWAGHIEFHLNSSDWNKHGHQKDKAYGNVIAHFVLNHDKEIFIDDFKLPVVELKNNRSINQFDKYSRWQNSINWIPCQKSIGKVGKKAIKSQMNLSIENRLNRKTKHVISLFRDWKNDEKKVFSILLARALGGKLNQEGMQSLMEKVEFSTLAHLGYDFARINSYLLGLSGLRQDKEFEYQKKLYQVIPLNISEWKTFGMRPASRPEIRITQLATILAKSNQIHFNAEIESWQDFFRVNEFENRMISKDQFKHILINVLVPFLSALSWFKDDKVLRIKSMNILRDLKAEQNTIIDKWKNIGINPENSLESQALLELKNEYCNQKKCLFCIIGRKVLES